MLIVGVDCCASFVRRCLLFCVVWCVDVLVVACCCCWLLLLLIFACSSLLFLVCWLLLLLFADVAGNVTVVL